MNRALARPGAGILLAAACAACSLLAACSAATRHKVLTSLFDGVPPMRTTSPEAAQPRAGGESAASRLARPREHGPYAAHLCGACHDSAATNALVVPKDQLCMRCHELRLDRKFVHGPVASGGCLVCHDPHSSPNPLLLVSASDSFCFHCHEAQVVARIEGHEGVNGGCTECHDAHASDQRFLLK
jgi:predicted CXXCH cytochrome family protein